MLFEQAGATTHRNDVSLWLWVPAFACVRRDDEEKYVWRTGRSVRGSSNSLSPKSMMATPPNHVALVPEPGGTLLTIMPTVRSAIRSHRVHTASRSAIFVRPHSATNTKRSSWFADAEASTWSIAGGKSRIT